MHLNSKSLIFQHDLIAHPISRKPEMRPFKELTSVFLLLTVVLCGLSPFSFGLAPYKGVGSVSCGSVNSCVGEIQMRHALTNPTRAHMTPLRGGEHPYWVLLVDAGTAGPAS